MSRQKADVCIAPLTISSHRESVIDFSMPFMDLGTGAMLWSNIPIMLALGFLAVRELKRYDKDLKDGKFPRHDAPSIVDRAEGKDD